MHIRKPIFEDYFLTRVETSFFYVKFVFVKKNKQQHVCSENVVW